MSVLDEVVTSLISIDLLDHVETIWISFLLLHHVVIRV